MTVPNDSDFERCFHGGADLLRRGRVEEAIVVIGRAVSLRPNHAQARHNLAMAFRRQGNLSLAADNFIEALLLDPHLSATRLILVGVLKSLGRHDEMVRQLRVTVLVDPGTAAAWRMLGLVLKGRGNAGPAREAFKRAAQLDPQDAASRFGAVMALLPQIYDRQDEIADARAAYAEALEALPGWLRLDTTDGAAEAADSYGSFLPYYLAYQGESDRDLQSRLGRLAADLLGRRHPEFAHPPAVPPELPIRVAIVSGHFWWHTIWKLFIRGWMEGFDRRRFRLSGYSTNSVSDGATAAARAGFDNFREGDTDFFTLARRIREDRPHVVLFPEIGMDNLVARLAAIRLAPFQYVAWGHPDTTGLPTIDAFLSSDLMEPPGAEEHYSERLVRLPGLGICYPPLDVPEEPLDLTAFGIGPGEILYLCCQFLSKYLPGDDALIARIAAALPTARFLFIDPRSEDSANRLRARLHGAFDRAGVADGDRRVTFLPYLSPGRYASLNRQADVYLDSVGWSGGNTTLEAAAHGLPIVTWPRGLMRGRHTAAILTVLGVTGTVADSADAYVDIAVRLGLDVEFRQSVRETTLRGLPVLHGDRRPMRALEDFLEAEVFSTAGVVKNGG